MGREIYKLSAREVETTRAIKRHSDGGGLYLVVSDAKSKRWAFIYRNRTTRKWSEMGLGVFPDVTLAAARASATAARWLLAEGKDPIDEKRARLAASRKFVPTLAVAVDEFVESQGRNWRSPKYKKWFKRSLERFVPELMTMRADAVETEHIFLALNRTWGSKPATSLQVRERIERVLDFAKVRGYRTGENPAQWRGLLANLLPKAKRLKRGHHAAMPYARVPALMKRLRSVEQMSSKCLQFTILTAARTKESTLCEWIEIDFKSKLWNVPASKMKAERAHVVPLTAACIEILTELRKSRRSQFVFPGRFTNRPQSLATMAYLLRRIGDNGVTVHGFRSSFRDWAGDETEHAREVAEAALAHKVGDDVEISYRRSTALDRRRKLMEDWDRFCNSPKEKL